MNRTKPNFKDLDFAERMGHKLKSDVEKQLLNDLKFYKISEDNLIGLKAVSKGMTRKFSMEQ